MKKLLLSVCAFVFLFSANAFGTCTAEDVESEMRAMMTTMDKISENRAKRDEVNAYIEKTYSAEFLEFSKLGKNMGEDEAKRQVMIDKGCDLFRRVNADLAKYQ